MDSKENKMIKTLQAFHEARKDWAAYHTCCLDISLYNRYQEGDYLRHTIQWINDRFTHCIVNLGDTLHRYNLQADYNSMQAAHIRARQLGNEWLGHNQPLLDNFDIPYKVIRNDNWLEDSSFKAVHQALRNFYKDNKEFAAVVDQDVAGFISRQNNAPPEEAAAISRAYLLEETAVDIMYGKQGGVAHLYPGRRFGCYWYLAGNAKNIPASIRGLENSTFKRLAPKRMFKSYEQNNNKDPLRALSVSDSTDGIIIAAS